MNTMQKALITMLILAAGLLPHTVFAATTYYADAARPDDAGAGTSWATAKKTIQAAVDLTVAGDTVLVTNGVYSTGGKVTPGSTWSTTSRVVIAKAIMVRSVNGSAVTFIQGWGPNGQCGKGAVRGVYLTNATLVGFTITNGFTQAYGAGSSDRTGGGIFLENGGVVSNCALNGNKAGNAGGGAYLATSGILQNCTLSGNRAAINVGGSGSYGGGAYGGMLQNCMLNCNTTVGEGGGASDSTLQNCVLSGNMAPYGGGASYSTLQNCLLNGNAAKVGGGAYQSALQYCMLSRNYSADNGGGAYYSTLQNCVLNGNTATIGGGAEACTLSNCTVNANSAMVSAGGLLSCIAYNSIVYDNTAPTNANWDSSIFTNCCTLPLPPGALNITNDPQLVNASHIAVNSPCIGAGSTSYAMGTDIDGQSWKNPPAIGCDEVYDNALTGMLSVAINASYITAVVGAELEFVGDIQGIPASNIWRFGDGVALVNKVIVRHAWAVTGTYQVILRVFNSTYPLAVAATVGVDITTLEASMRYVNEANATPEYPYATWATAATRIQDAVDSVPVGGAGVLVADGVYNTGGKVPPGSKATSRVVIARAMTVQSVNGPAKTFIDGAGAVRGVYLSCGAALIGFTVQSGRAQYIGSFFDHYGGGILFDCGGYASNCVLSGNSAVLGGGCAFRHGGSLQNCTLSGNSGEGAGAFCEYGGTVQNCVFTGNNGNNGGGVYCANGGTLLNCLLSGNSAQYHGGGARMDGGALLNCTLSGNLGGGVEIMSGAITNCVVYFNTPYNVDIAGYAKAAWSCSYPLEAGTGNISNDPQFVNYAAGDFRLKPSSPCINAGTNLPCMESQTDLDGNPRILGGRVDMGAYETYLTTNIFAAPAVTAPFTVPSGGTGVFVVTNWPGVTFSGDKLPGAFVATPWLTNGIAQTSDGTRWTNQYVALQMSERGSTNLFLFRCLSNDFMTYSATTTVVSIVNQHIAPFVDITNAPMTVGYKTVSTSIAGTNNQQIVGGMWTNGLNGITGAIQVTGERFQATDIPLDVGDNVVTVFGSNAWGVLANDQISIVRLDEAASAPAVTNVHLAQRLRSKLMDIRYDVSDPDDTNLMMTIAISTNAGATFDIVPVNASDGGAEKSIGQGVTPGTNKWIVWNAGVDWDNQFTTQMVVRVAASNTVDTTPAGMALIPAGPFAMGDTFSEGNSAELPVHTVMVSAFYMDKYEVTCTLWTSVYQWATSNGYAFDNAGSGKATNHPVQMVSWYDCVKWCNTRSEMEGLTPCYYTNAAQTLVYRGGSLDLSNEWVKWSANGYRLPTEAEWEKAARGGLTGRRFPWYDLNITFTNANYFSYWSGGAPYYSYDKATQAGYHPSFTNAPMPYTSPAGYFAANGYGLYDMAGNVWEWCWDYWYDGAWYGTGGATQADTRGPSSGNYRVLRGGSWFSYYVAFDTRCALRYYQYPGSSNGGPLSPQDTFGFRCAMGMASAIAPSAVSAPALCETRDPVVVITSAPPAVVSYDVSTVTIVGTNGPALIGSIWWSNALTLAAGAAQVSSFEFHVSSIALGIGTNVISVYGTNIVEIQTNASVTIVRGQDDLPPVIAPDALVFSGTNGALLEAGVVTAIVWRVAGIWDNADGTNLLLPSIAILTTNTGAVVAQPGTNVPNMAGLVAWTPWGFESETTAYVVRIEAVDSAGNRTNRVFFNNVFTVVPEPGLCAGWLCAWMIGYAWITKQTQQRKEAP